MPYPNEHSARVRDPGDFEPDSFRRKTLPKSPGGKGGVVMILGRLKGETTMTVQAYRFPRDLYTVAEAKQWLKDNNITYISFEPASGKIGDELEYKTLPLFMKKLDTETRIVTGIFAVHGNVDESGDMSINGSFEKRLSDGGRQRVKFLWSHNSFNPPVASIKEIREVGRDELPEKVLEWAPDATGGVEITRQYYDNVPLADWIFHGIEKGDISEMSYAYHVHEFKIIEQDDGKRPIRVLLDVELFDISDVNLGMNPATVGVKGLPVSSMTFVQHSAMVEATIEEFMARVMDRKTFREQEGRTLSEVQRERLAKLATEIGTILGETQPRAEQGAVLSEISKFLRLEAHIRGV